MIKVELKRFLFVGILLALVDFILYRILDTRWPIDVAKAGSFVVVLLGNYFFNRLWTFRHTQYSPGSTGRYVALYSVTISANVIVNGILLRLMAQSATTIEIAFILATGISASLNFLGLKYFVFRPESAGGCM